MKLWSIMAPETARLLQTGTTLRTDPKFFEDPESLHAYEWMANQVRRKNPQLKNPPEYPWWAWYHCHVDGSGIPPLIGDYVFWPPGKLHARVELEVPDEQVVLTFFDPWHLCLGGHYLAPEEQSDAFRREVKQKGVDPVSFQQKPLGSLLHSPVLSDFRQRLEASWHHVIFDIEMTKAAYDEAPLGYGGVKYGIQACFPEVRPEFVRSVEHFVGAEVPEGEDDDDDDDREDFYL